MNFNAQTPLDQFLSVLFERYMENVPDVKKITQAMISKGIIGSQDEIVNDHIAFRTLGVPHLGLASLEKIFLANGYKKMDPYFFKEKKLDAYWYAPPSPAYPRIFVSELRVKDLSAEAQAIIHKYTDGITSDPVDAIDLSNGQAIGEFLHQPLWETPTKAEYARLLEESEYAAWVIYNRYYLNHYTISVHALKEGYNKLSQFNALLESIGVKLNTSGGVIKESADGLLLQSSTVAPVNEVEFAGGEKMAIAGSYVEFAERRVLPQFAHLNADDVTREHRRDGFEANNADKIFESTYTEQINK
ncbi:DUF1338 domain-containing protein [Pseudoflavitalea sp. G-6-1-2]|uniref:DUF1338 domain-containing protein n=1 Tax=Pseudoflavitalea sp. G-6-1-2 TaxID=2728841 RepID=UPI00146CC68D|nr:DUF1338 domain-containing protein [Pseudoflavitalea sp. G-6-1-2]NML22227.1 DUF1338 domain-containing protein [Pseudoflavitalea sp. G-6-1-2]